MPEVYKFYYKYIKCQSFNILDFYYYDGQLVKFAEKDKRLVEAYNKEHGIIPKTIKKDIRDPIEISSKDDLTRAGEGKMSASERRTLIEKLTGEMKAAAKSLDFERAAYLRDTIAKIRK